MEEDVKVLEDYLNAIDTFGTIDYKCINNLYNPIQNILFDYRQKLKALDKSEELIKQLGNELEKLQKENKELLDEKGKDSERYLQLHDNYQQLKRDFEYIEHEHDRLDKRNNELIKENEEWQRAYQKEKDAQFNILTNSIPKSVIQDKIDKLNREFDFYAGREHAEWQDGEFDGEVCDDISLKISVLKELLKGDK